MKTLDQIAADLQGYDPQAMTCDDVLSFLTQLITPVRETLELALFAMHHQLVAPEGA